MPEATPDQAAEPQSVIDQIAAKFGITDEPEETAAPAEAEADAEEAVSEADEAEVEYDGERFRVPRKLEKAILQERDYTQKTQQLAEQRRQVEYQQKALEATKVEREFHESVGQELQQLALMDNYLGQLKNVNVNDLAMEDGFKHWMQVQQLKEQRDALQKSIEGKRAEYGRRAREAIDNLKAQARELLSKQLPSFTPEVSESLKAHAKTLGYSEADFDMIELDPRAATMLYKAMRYDQLQAGKAEAVAKVASPTVRPGASNPMPQAVKDKLAFGKAMKSAKTSQEKARLIENKLAGMF